MGDILLDALLDSLKILPFLFIAYVLIEIFSHYFSHKLENGITTKWSSVIGGFLGIIPQCGFSVLSAELYARRFITIGTLFAVFLATSDEAILILLASPEGIQILLPLIGIKLVSAIVFGLIIDCIFHKRNKEVMINQQEIAKDNSVIEPPQGEEIDHCGCGHCHKADSKFDKFIIMPLFHSLKIFIFILAVNIVFGTIIYFVGEENLISFLQSSSAFAPVISALVGLIPNCASSVIISELYVLGGINFASLTAGLLANVGIASVMLFRKLKIKESVLILVSLFVLSVAVGYILMLI